MSLTRTIMSLTRTGHIFMMMIDEAVPCAQIRSDQITHTRAGNPPLLALKGVCCHEYCGDPL